jgi:hypothetical protein
LEFGVAGASVEFAFTGGDIGPGLAIFLGSITVRNAPRFTGHNKHCTRGSYMAPSPASRIYRGGRVPGNPFSRSNRSVS